jgi:hypothetical protein
MSSVRRLLACTLVGLPFAGCTEQPNCASDEALVSSVCRTVEVDAGTLEEDAGSEQPLMCGNGICRDTETSLFVIDACCDTDLQNVCGVSITSALGPVHGCFAKHRPGNPSESCSALLDQLDKPLMTLDPGDDGALTFNLDSDVGTYPGCCSSTGECGVASDDLDIGDFSLALGAGCIPLSRIDLSGLRDTTPVTISRYCVPSRMTDDEACPPTMSSGGVDLCAELAAEGLPLVDCDAAAATPPWVCARRSLPSIDGEPPEVEAGSCMQFLPKSMRGCGATGQGEGCIANVSDEVFGCVDADGG